VEQFTLTERQNLAADILIAGAMKAQTLAILLPNFVNRANVRMIQRRGRSRLPLEAFQCRRI
jgi:hypothetical protein